MDKPIPEAVRHQFETWARPKWRHREDFDQRIGAPRGTYNNIEVQAAWEAWQALAAAQQQGGGEVCGCGRPGEYFDVIGRASCNKHMRCSAPPSAPVGVEVASLPALWRQREDNGEDRTEFDKGYEQASDECAHALEQALAQQPAAPTWIGIDWAAGQQPAAAYEVKFATSARLAKPATTEKCDFCGANPGDLHAYDCTALDAQQPAAVDEKYSELIYAVSRKYPGESRHETALRYIRQAESADHGPAQADTQHQEPTT